MTCVWTVCDSWMEERDPAFVAKAVEIIELELHPPTDGLTYCVDEKTGIGVREPAAPSEAVAPGRPARRACADVRHGTAAVLAACAVQTGQVQGLVRQRHRSAEFIELLRLLDQQAPPKEVIHLILDPLRMHCSAEVAADVAYRPWRFRFQWLPLHASWLSFIEAWFALLAKKCLARSAWATFTAAAAISAFMTPTTRIRPTPSPGRRASASISGSRTSSRPKARTPRPTRCCPALPNTDSFQRDERLVMMSPCSGGVCRVISERRHSGPPISAGIHRSAPLG